MRRRRGPSRAKTLGPRSRRGASLPPSLPARPMCSRQRSPHCFPSTLCPCLLAFVQHPHPPLRILQFGPLVPRGHSPLLCTRRKSCAHTGNPSAFLRGTMAAVSCVLWGWVPARVTPGRRPPRRSPVGLGRGLPGPRATVSRQVSKQVSACLVPRPQPAAILHSSATSLHSALSSLLTRALLPLPLQHIRPGSPCAEGGGGSGSGGSGSGDGGGSGSGGDGSHGTAMQVRLLGEASTSGLGMK